MLKKLMDFLTSTKQSNAFDDEINGKPVVATSELTIKVAPKPAKVKKYTKGSLGKMTKVQLEEVGRSEFGVELDRRHKKDDLIKQLLKEQRTKTKG
jgi:hypothetical protein